jgi:lipopolysaccharide assembly protein A
MSERRRGRIWRRLRLLIAAPFLLVLVTFVLSNRQPVTISFWPTDVRWDVSLSVALLIAAAVALVVGAVMVWISELGQRRRARRAEAAVRLLEEQVQELKIRLGATTNQRR